MKANILKKALASNKLTSKDTSFVIYDLDYLNKRLQDLKNAFPANTIHAIATKACPLPAILKIQKAHGLGAEVASFEELYLAEKSKIPSQKIVYDGPCKTEEEVIYALKKGVHINADSLEELELIGTCMQKVKKSISRVGLRINPLVKKGKISLTSVGDKKSKFGVVITKKDEIAKALKKYPFINTAHVHIGSQGVSPELMATAVKKVGLLFDKHPQVKFLDIGGGLPIKQVESDRKIKFQDYVDILNKECSFIFKRYQLITEFGRTIFHNAAMAVSKISSIKNKKQISIHLGADFFMRKVYQPQTWFYDASVFNKNGSPKRSALKDYRVVGPLCFAGDIFEESIPLPHVNQDDYFVVKNVGAYTLSMWSRHCSRLTPKVVGVEKEKVSILKKRETLEGLYHFWT